MMTPENEMEQLIRDQETQLNTNQETMMKTSMKPMSLMLIALAIALSMLLAACGETTPAPQAQGRIQLRWRIRSKRRRL
jgi:uncharacterized membrane protein (DUF106 family)